MPGCSFMTIVCQPLSATAVLTHASTVIPVVRSSSGASGTVITLLVPLNEYAPPYLPAEIHVAPETVPALPLPETSATVVPDVSNEYAATRPGVAEWAAGSVAPATTASRDATAAMTAPRRPRKDAAFHMGQPPELAVRAAKPQEGAA